MTFLPDACSSVGSSHYSRILCDLLNGAKHFVAHVIFIHKLSVFINKTKATQKGGIIGRYENRLNTDIYLQIPGKWYLLLLSNWAMDFSTISANCRSNKLLIRTEINDAARVLQQPMTTRREGLPPPSLMPSCLPTSQSRPTPQVSSLTHSTPLSFNHIQ